MKLSSLQKGLVGHWPLDEQSFNPATKRFTDKTPNENHGTGNGTQLGGADPGFQTDRMGQLVRACPFNGSNDNVRIPDSVSLNPINAMTAMVWVKGVAQNNKGILGHYDDNGQGSFLLFSDDATYSRVSVFISDNGSWDVAHRKYYISSIAAFDSAYHLIGFTFNAGTLKLYIDGVEDTNPTIINDDAITTIHDSTADVMLGCYLNNNMPTDFFNGDLAGAKIWNRALSAEEWLLAYESYRPKISMGSLMKGLVLDMPLNTKRYNAGNSKFDDLTPYENRGTNTGGDVDTDHTTFNGISDVVRIPGSESLSPTSVMTGMVWVKGSLLYYKVILSHWDNALERGFSLSSYTDNKFRISISDNGTWDVGHRIAYISSIIPFENAWHQIGFTFNAGTLKLYIDGVEDINPTKSADDAITTIHDSTADVMLGCYLNNNIPGGLFNGDLAGAKIWNRALTDAEWLLAYDQTKGLYL